MRVLVYTSSSCPYCKKVKNFLREHSVTFKEINLNFHRSAARELKEKTGQTGVPVILAGNYKIIGFDENKLRRILRIK